MYSNHMGPFLMNPEGVGRLFVPMGGEKVKVSSAGKLESSDRVHLPSALMVQLMLTNCVRSVCGTGRCLDLNDLVYARIKAVPQLIQP